MPKIQAPVEQLQELIRAEVYMSERLDHAVLKQMGVFLLKNALPATLIEPYLASYLSEVKQGSLTKTAHHLTEVKIGAGQFLNQILREPAFIRIAGQFFNGQVGSDFLRVVKKDERDYAAVFLHQDCCYQIGSLERYSLFIALTDCGSDNGGLLVYPGTHHYGSLGDAGEIADILPPGYPSLAVELVAGDILIMNSAIWHQSPENVSRKNRIYLEVHLQHIDEPTTVTEICGVRQSPWRLAMSPDEIFANSRTQRLRALYQQIDQLSTKLSEQ